MESFRVHLDKEALVFSAAHFITFNGNICERLHGHNWRVRCEVEGPLDENRYVIDFIALRDGLRAIVDTLEHRVLLPDSHAKIHVESKNNEVEATFEERRWVFPVEDCMILPVQNTTAEEIARYVWNQLVERLTDDQKASISTLSIWIDENYGQWAIYTNSINET